MIQNILDLLEIAKEQNARGKYVDIALGKNKLPAVTRLWVVFGETGIRTLGRVTPTLH